jgi:hypothetical protein
MNFFRKLAVVALGGASVISGCAEQAQNVTATYIPSIIYRGATCQELAHERRVLADYVMNVTSAQRNSAQSDTALVTASLFIFWPAIFALPLTVDQSAQLATARGHYDALMKAQVEQGCVASSTAVAGSRYVQSAQHGFTVPTPDWKRRPGQFPPL